MSEFRHDEVGYWSEIKLRIINKYARAYSTILSARRDPASYHIYIDGFAGSGSRVSRTTGDMIEGSPAIALSVEPPFKEYHFIDLNGDKVEQLMRLAARRSDVFIHQGDCNTVLR